ncbi:uncharacterized protein KGF55_003729 [Candida pseudojiufengensis]|uniref:uncharacterized protein n=1 Tax=Candida pseudojiufengensis TaxID=497109 RepID=UPI002223F367|nr:uncharacterized protein KGF55_003729 [Candida pseudojiufengensis]KAI5962653.1 hypothetical protein KGF55_003729 [Candida pseudojiufengensis]
MLSQLTRRTLPGTLRTCKRLFASNYPEDTEKSSPRKSDLPPHKDGLYFGRFTKKEYEEAAKTVKEQILKLENDIKGDFNVRENIGKYPQFPEQGPSAKEINNLTDFFEQTIKLTGAISLSAYMRQCLTHPHFGYYTTRDPLNLKTGDFVTSPEISSIFGEMIGIWYFTIWQSQNQPSNIRFIEFGPGKGTLMYDIIKTFNRFIDKVSPIKPKIELVMIEASGVLRQEQYKLLCDGNASILKPTDQGYHESTTKWGNPITWVDTEKSIDHNTNLTNYVIAHEFFDALPIKSFIKQEDGWRELVVEHTPSVNNDQLKLETTTKAHDNPTLETAFHLSISPKETPSSMIPKISNRYKDLPIGSRIEICTEAELYIMKIAQLVGEKSGAALIIDYGVVNEIPENSLRGIYKHQFVSPFYKPGEVDLSIDVDFSNLKSLAENLVQIEGPITQGEWLTNVGIGYRVDQLIKQNSSNEELQDQIYGAYKRLVDDDEMGKIYKFMALLPKGSEKSVGF